MKKQILIGVSLCPVVLLMLGSLSNVVGYQTVKSTMNDSLLIQITQKVEWDKQEQKLNSIFDDFKKKISNATTQEECKLVFRESLIELEKYDFLGALKANEAYKLIDDSYTSGNPYTVYGESSNTLFLERIGVFIYEHRDWMPLFFLFWNRNHLVHVGSYIIFGNLVYCELHLEEKHPAKGYLKIIGPNGYMEYNDTFYGQLERIDVGSLGDPDYYTLYCVGVKGFQGLLINNQFYGTAKEVDIIGE